MKQFTIALLALTLLLSACAPGGSVTNQKLSVVCTAFPQYDWARQILGDAAYIELTLLLDSGIDLHNYQPSVDDIIKISACDLFIYVGGESDEWVDDALKEAANKNMVILNLLDVLGSAAKTEEIIEGIEEGGEHESKDEHVWLSLKNAQAFCTAITEALSVLDAKHAEVYKDNLKTYIEKLSALDSEYQALVSAAPVKTLLFGDRFPFRYLVEDYGLDYYAAFAGCSTETEASFETVIFLARKADELRLKTIMVTESTDQAVAKTIRDNTLAKNQQLLVLDSMQSTASMDVENGVTYLSIMENNLSVLMDALR